jgi:hypothetical protein
MIPVKQRKRIKPKKVNPSVLDKLEEELDTAWRCFVYSRAGFKCERCGSDKKLEAHHIIGRWCKTTRWDKDNGVCLCKDHHEMERSDIQTQYDRQNTELYQRLLKRSKKVAHFTEQDLRKKLAELTNEGLNK